MINIIVMILISLFYVIFIGRSVMLLISGISPFALGTGKNGWRRFVEVCFLAGFLLWTFMVVMSVFNLDLHVLPGFFHISIFNHTALRITGICLICAAVIIFTLSLISFGSSWRVGVDTQNPGKLVTAGIFMFTRNPVFLSMYLMFLGTFFVFANIFFLIILVAAVPGIHFQILAEEKFLEKRYGQAYAEYRKKVRRYL